MKYFSALLFSLLFIAFQAKAQNYNLGNTGAGAGWFKLGRLYLPQQGADAEIKILAGGGYNAILNQQGESVVRFRTSNANSNYQGFFGSGSFYNTGKTKILSAVKVIQIDQSTWDFYATLPTYTGGNATLSLTSLSGTWEKTFAEMAPPEGQVFLDLSEELVFNSPLSFTQSVGIGTNVPDNQQGWERVLDVYGTNHSKLLVRSSQIKTGVFSDQTWGDPVGRIGTESNHNLQLMAGYGNTVMALNTTGNVGIGTNNPENADGWGRVLDIHGNNHAKAIVSTNSVYTGLWSHDSGFYGALAGGMVGTYSNHPFSILTNKTAKFTVASSGNVGIGTTAPEGLLHLSGAYSSINGGDSYQYARTGLIVQANTGGRTEDKGAQIEFVIPANTGGENPWGQGRIITVAGNTSSGNAVGKMILGTRRHFDKLKTGAQWFYGDDIVIDGIGNVGIGTLSPKEKLSVYGTVRAMEVKVEATNWPDYVFEEDYKVRTLEELESYIKINKHLPEMPNAKEVEANGVAVGAILKMQQKKIEELTLYMIDQEKKIEMEKSKIRMLENSVSELKTMIESIKK